MKVIRKSAAGLALGVVLSITWLIGSSLVRDSQFARAQERVDAARAQISNVGDLATAFKTVGRAVEPSVVNIDVVKTVSTNQMFGRLFGRGGRGNPNGPNGNRNPNANPNQDNAPDGTFPFDIPPQLQQQGTGSGVIMEADGDTAYIVTNNHVAGGGGEMTVTLHDGRVIKNAKLVGADPKSDLAVVKIQADHVIPAKWGNSDDLEQGDWILAFGSPFRYSGSMTHGIVSATNRNRVGIISSQFADENFIQVDAPINPGNSGGPLVNLRGEVVGINTAIASESGGFSGLGFAIPSNQVKVVFNSLKTSGRVVRGWLGVEIKDVAVSPEEATQLGYQGKDGVLVHRTFKDTPAWDKLEPDDIVTAIDGKKVQTMQALRNQIAATPPNTNVKMTVFRDGKTQDVTVKLGEQPDEMNAVATAANPEGARRQGNMESPNSPEALGMQLASPTEELLSQYSLDKGVKGAVVTNVRRNSPAYLAELQPGDVIIKVNGTSVSNSDEAADALSKGDLKKGIQLRVMSRDSLRSVFLQSDEAK